MQIIIKKYDSIDEVQFLQLTRLCFDESNLISIIHSPNLKFAFSAFIEDKFVGILLVWTNRFHPYCTYFRILCNPFYSKHNVEEILLSKIEELNLGNHPLQTSNWDSVVHSRDVYISHGFTIIRRTYTPKLKVEDVEDIFSSNENHNIKTLKDILSNELLMGKLAELVKRNYEQMHLANPVADIGIEKWQDLILADDVIQNGSFIYLDLDTDEIIAYSFLHESDKNDSLELGWCGSTDISNIELIRQLVMRQLKFAFEFDIHSLIGEFDTTDQFAMEVSRCFPFAPCPTWITYQK